MIRKRITMKISALRMAGHCSLRQTREIRRWEATGHPCAGSAEKETSLGITPRVPIAVVVARPGEHFRFVMFAFDSVGCSGNDRCDILCCRCFFLNRRAPLGLHHDCLSAYRTVLTRPIYNRCDVEQAKRQRHNGAERHNHTENVTQHGADSKPLASTRL